MRHRVKTRTNDAGGEDVMRGMSKVAKCVMQENSDVTQTRTSRDE